MSENKNAKKEKKEKKIKVPNGNIFKIMIIVLLFIIVCGIGFVGALLIMNQNKSKSVSVQTPAVTQKAVENNSSNNSSNNSNNNSNNSNDSSSDSQQSKYAYEIKDKFTVNLADQDKTRYLQVQVYIGYDNSKMASEFDSKLYVLRDAIINILRSKKASDFTITGTEALKQEILQKISPLFSKGKPSNIYFTDLIVQ